MQYLSLRLDTYVKRYVYEQYSNYLFIFLIFFQLIIIVINYRYAVTGRYALASETYVHHICVLVN